jgi:hypothetical protein
MGLVPSVPVYLPFICPRLSFFSMRFLRTGYVPSVPDFPVPDFRNWGQFDFVCPRFCPDFCPILSS